MNAIIDKIIANTSLGLVVIGLFLITLGAAGGWPNPALTIKEPGWRIVLGGAGGFVALTGLFSIVRKKDQGDLPSAESCDVHIVTPSAGDTVGHNFPVSGTLKILPKGYALWVFTSTPEKTARLYWPQEPAQLRGHTWHSHVNYLRAANDVQTVRVFLVGPQGQALMTYFKTAGEINKNWPGISHLTDDCIECATVQVLCRS